jgi:hypothetical protein
VHRPPAALIAGLAVGVLLAAGLLVFLMTRIGHDSGPAPEAPPPTFASPQALVQYLDRHGLACDDYKAVSAAGQGRCLAGGHEVGVGVYATHGDAEAQWVALSGSQGPVYMAVGENWTVEGPAGWTKRVADVMKAQYRSRS